MIPQSWNTASRENCGDSCVQEWKSIVAGNPMEPTKKTVLAVERDLQQEAALSKITNELEQFRGKLLSSAKEDLDLVIWKLNESCMEKIKTLTSRLVAFLGDIKSQLEKSNYFEEIIPTWKTQWDANVDQWNCDVHDALQTLHSQIVQALRGSESSLINSRKFTAVQIENFLNDRVIKLNQLTMTNERMYSETERQLKLVFDTLLQKWLISYSYREIVATECEELQEDESYTGTAAISKTVEIVEKIIAGLEEEEPEFNQLSALKIYLDHLRMCQQHVKLHLKEALLHLKKHLLEKQQHLDERESQLHLGELWADIVAILKEQNDDFENYSKQAAYAWNKFLRRIHSAEHAAAVAINKARAAKLTKLLSSEEKINILLDQLREGNSVTHLEHVYDKIAKGLENVEFSVLSCREDEDELIKNLVSACFAAYDVYSLQMKIMQENSLNTDTDVYCVEVELDYANELSDLELIRMRFCVYSAQTWIQGLKETLSMMEAEIPKFLKTLLENVVFVYKGESEFWLMLQLDKLTRRKKRIRSNVLEIRAAELYTHDQAQNHFQQVIDKEWKRAKAMLKEIKDDLTHRDNEVVKYIDATKTDNLGDTPEKKIKLLKEEAFIANHEQTRAQVVRKAKYEVERVFKWLESMCLTYLNSLKLFHEGGNYSADECEQVLKRMSNNVKKFTKEADKSVKKLEHVFSSTKEAFKKKLGKIVYPEPSEEALLKAAEREASDRLSISFNRLKEMIKNETYKATLNLKCLKESMAEAEESNSFLKWHEAMNEVEASCGYFDLSKMFPMLELSIVLGAAHALSLPNEHQVTLPNGHTGSSRKSRPTNRSVGSKMSQATLLRERRKSKAQRKTTQGSTLTSRGKKSSPDSLFHWKTFMDENNYLSNTKTLINDAHSRIAVILQDAYNKYKVPIEYSEMQRNKAISTLKHYNLQCESVWTQFFNEYMNMFLALCRSILSYILLLKDRHIYYTVKSAMKLKADHKTNLAALNVEGLKEKIDGKLKPWHGYPLNKPLLQSLLKDVVGHCKEQLHSRKTVNETYKEELKKLVDENKAHGVDILEDAKFFFLELYTNMAYQSFLESIQAYIDSKEFGQRSVDLGWLKKGLQDYCTEHWKQIMSASAGNEGPAEPKLQKYDIIEFTYLPEHKFWSFLPHMRNIINILSAITAEFQLPSRRSRPTLVTGSTRSFSILRSANSWVTGEGREASAEEIFMPLWQKFKEEMQKHEQDFEAAAIKNLTQAKKAFDSVAWDLTRWKSEWISNIKEVNRLYLINPILDPPPKKIASDPAGHLRKKRPELN